MLSEYIISLADVSFHIVAYIYARFRNSGKNPMRFAVFWPISLRFCDFRTPSYAPLLEVIFLFVRILAKRLNREITRLARRFTLPASRVYTARSGRVFDRNSARDWGKRTIS